METSTSGTVIAAADELGITLAEVAAFYRDNWKRRIALEVPKFLQWQFVDVPGQNQRCRVCVAVRGSQILGIMGINERPFRLNGVDHNAAELTTWMISEKGRGSGLGIRMLDYLKSRYSILLGTGLTEDALNVYLRYGFNYWRYIPRFFRVLDVDAVEPYSKISPLGHKLARHRLQGVGAETARYDLVSAREAASASSFLRDLNAYSRSEDYFAWRYQHHPVFEYETLRTQSGAYIVVRKDAVPGMRFAHVTDLLACPEQMSEVLSVIDQYALNNDLHAVDCTCTSSALAAHFITGGWFSSVDEPFFAFLSLFHPPELKETQTTSIIYWSASEQAALADLGRLHITKGDMDLDRPTISFYETNGITTS